jgi:pyroglutamyl-peptidase
MKILLTGFKSFGGASYNMTERILSSLSIQDVDVLILDVHYKYAYDTLYHHLKTHAYDMIISFGEAPIQKIQLEYLALNRMHARIPDERNFQPKHQKIDETGFETYASLLPLSEMESFFNANFIPYQVSYHAGTYVCNDLFYRMMQMETSIPRGFIHIPHDEIYQNDIKKAIESMIQWLLT